MKKLMMAAAIVCVAVATQAATVSWSEGSGIYADTQGNMCDASAPVYLILTDTISQENLVNGFLAGTADAATYASAVGGLNGYFIQAQQVAITGPSLTEGDGAYFAVMNGKNLYISASADIGWDGVTMEYKATFDDYAASFSDPLNAYAGNSAWYTAAVPEPTSGLLLLLGVAGLALRRRRA